MRRDEWGESHRGMVDRCRWRGGGLGYNVAADCIQRSFALLTFEGFTLLGISLGPTGCRLARTKRGEAGLPRCSDRSPERAPVPEKPEMVAGSEALASSSSWLFITGHLGSVCVYLPLGL